MRLKKKRKINYISNSSSSSLGEILYEMRGLRQDVIILKQDKLIINNLKIKIKQQELEIKRQGLEINRLKSQLKPQIKYNYFG